jgi:S-formylglutathione hydrolase FrmB
MSRVLAVAVALAAVAAGVAPAAGHAAGPYDGCDPGGTRVRVGVVACQTLPSEALGATTAFSYYVPPACRSERCPTLYLLHGFGGDLRSMLGTADKPTTWVTALGTKPQLPIVLVAPDGRTVPDGFGPGAGLEGFWVDWNPRYAKGGDSRRYDTPAPRFAAELTDELVPYVESHFPVGHGREWRSLAGTSLGGYGSYAIGLMHPDFFASIGAVSGIMNILLLPGLDASADGGSGGVAPPAQLPATALPGAAGASAPLDALPEQARGFAVATYAFGDPSVDQSYYRGHMPRDLAINAHAIGRVDRKPTQSLVVHGFSNDAVPRQAGDFSNPPGYFGAQAFEAIVLVSNIEQNQAFADAGVQQHYEMHPGIHSDTYWDPYLRGQLEAQYAAMRHPGGGGNPAPLPTTFDYRSNASQFEVWGWHFSAKRAASEFTDMTDVTCAGFTVRGTGDVTVTPPKRCHAAPATVRLGPGLPTAAPAGADEAPAYGNAVHVTLRHK